MEKIFNILQSKIYPHIPAGLQNLGISLYGYLWYKKRFGGDFNKYVQEFKEREFYTRDQWQKYQFDQLKKLLIHSFINVDYYHQSFRKAGFSLVDFENFKWDFYNHLPFLEKEDLRKYGTTSLLIKNLSKGSFISSSGSTGTPVRIYLPEYFHQTTSAIMETRVRNWAGVSYKTPRGMIGGRRIVPDYHVNYPLYRYNYIERQTYFSAYHLSKDTIEDYLEGLINNDVRYLTGYAMSIYIMATLLNDKQLVPPKLEAVITSSEKLTPKMRQVIGDTFQCEVFDSYSGCEACGFISQTPEGPLVFSPDSGILEVIDANGKEAQNGEYGELILTGLHNFDQPLIRYRIGDNVKLSPTQILVGGRDMVIISEISGRVEDVVIGPDGRKMVRFHSVFYDIDGLKLSQIEQMNKHLLQLNLVIDNKYDQSKSERILIERLTSQLGNIQVRFNYKVDLERTKNGKVRAVISHVAQ